MPAGVSAGLAVAFAGSRLIASLLYQVSPTDGLVIASVPVILVVIAIAAAAVPARRGSIRRRRSASSERL